MCKYSSGIFLFCLLFVSCQKPFQGHSLNEDHLRITLNKACGWCAPGDSLILTKPTTTYVYYPSSCSKEGPHITKATGTADWHELLNLLDLKKFNAINLNTCNICVDGCDEWITIQQKGSSHTIRYGSADAKELKEIKPFIDKLHQLRQDLKTQMGK